MEPTFTVPTPVIGNHPAGCSCSTCDGGRKRLMASPYVQRLIAQLTTVHEQLYKATSTMPSPAPELEERVLELTDELANAKEDNGVLTRSLDQSRKIIQEREKQLRVSEQNLSHFTSRANTAEAFLKTVAEALDCKDPAKLAEKAQKLQGDLGELKAAREGYETGRRDIQARLETALDDLRESKETAFSLQQQITTLERTMLDQQQGAERTIERQSKQLQQARGEAKAVIEAAQEQGVIRRAQFTVAGLITALVAGVAMYFVGRWAR